MTAARYRRRRLAVGFVVAVIALGSILWMFPSARAVRPLARVLGRESAAAPRLFEGRLLVYGRHALTPEQVGRLSRVVTGPVTAVHGGEIALASGLPDYPDVPVQTFTVDAHSYAAAAGLPSLEGQLTHGVVLSTTGAALRHVTVGHDVILAGGPHLPVTAIVDDHTLGGYEMATTSAVLGHPVAAGASYLLVDQGSSAPVTAARLREALPGVDLRIENTTRNGLMSSADTVLTQAQIKTEFGEFAVTTTGGSGPIRLDSTWLANWITSTSLPQLGVITCNKAVIAPLRAAMQEVTRLGLGRLIHTADFQREGGCWNPRVARLGAGQLSTHAWGIALDINVDDNPLGSPPVQDPRLVTIMAEHGFTWGGLWLRPDGAHFEWRGTTFK